MHLREQLTEKGKCSSFTNAEKGDVLPRAASVGAASAGHQTDGLIARFGRARALMRASCAVRLCENISRARF